MITKLDRAAVAGLLALAWALPDSDRPDAGSAASRGCRTAARRDGLLAGGMKGLGSATAASLASTGSSAFV